MLHSTFTQIATATTPERHLIIIGVEMPGTDQCSYELVDMDTGESRDIKRDRMLYYIKKKSLRLYDSSIVRREIPGQSFIPEDPHEQIIKFIRQTGLFPHHLLKQKKKAA